MTHTDRKVREEERMDELRETRSGRAAIAQSKLRRTPWWFNREDPRRQELIERIAAECPLETKVRGVQRLMEIQAERALAMVEGP